MNSICKWCHLPIGGGNIQPLESQAHVANRGQASLETNMETHWKPTGLQGVSGKLTMVDHGIGIFLVLGVTSTFAMKFPKMSGVGSHAVMNGKKVTAKRGIEVIA